MGVVLEWLTGRREFHRAYLSKDNRGNSFTMSAFEEVSSPVDVYWVVPTSINP